MIVPALLTDAHQNMQFLTEAEFIIAAIGGKVQFHYGKISFYQNLV
jgi:hypothetical protein